MEIVFLWIRTVNPSQETTTATGVEKAERRSSPAFYAFSKMPKAWKLKWNLQSHHTEIIIVNILIHISFFGGKKYTLLNNFKDKLCFFLFIFIIQESKAYCVVKSIKDTEPMAPWFFWEKLGRDIVHHLLPPRPCHYEQLPSEEMLSSSWKCVSECSSQVVCQKWGQFSLLRRINCTDQLIVK